MANSFDVLDNPLVRGARDVGTSFAIGSNGLLKMAGDLATLTTGKENALTRQAKENIQYLQEQKSPELLAAETDRDEAVNAEENPFHQAWTYVKKSATNPLLLATTVAETAPSSVGPGALGAGARMATGKLLARKGAEFATKVGIGTAVGVGALGGMADVGGDQYDELVRTLEGMDDQTAMQIPQVADLVQNRGSTIPQAKAAVALQIARETGLVAGAISAGSQFLPGGRTIEKALVGKAEKTAAPSIASRVLGAVKGAAGEATQESIEEGGGQVTKNILARPVEPEREAMAGVGPTVGQAIVGAGALGGMAGAREGLELSRREPTSQPVPGEQATAGMSGEQPAPAATKTSLKPTQEASLERSEEMTPEQFWAAVNVRQARLVGVEPNPSDIALVGEVAPPQTVFVTEVVNKALDEGRAALIDWKRANPTAPENIVLIYDPELLHNGYGVQGAFNEKENIILVNTAFTSPERLGQIVNHEWAHSTLATAEGKRAFAQFAEREIPADQLAELATRYKTEDRMLLLEEWIAENQEKAPGVISRIVARVREWLSGLGIVNLSDEEVADIMLRTLREQAENKVQPDLDRVNGGVEIDPNAEAYNQFTASQLDKPANRFSLQKLPMAGDVIDEKGRLKYTVPKKTLDVSHYSRVPDLTEIDPAYYGTGSGQHYHRMMRGQEKSFFFVGNSKPASYENVSGKGMTRYRTSIDSSNIYDMDKDPLNLWSAANPQKSEGMLKDLGYDGFYAKTDDGRAFVAVFYPTNIETGEFTRPETSAEEAMPEEKPRRKTAADLEDEAWQKKLASGKPLFSLGKEKQTPENLRKWAEGSAVVDEKGNPIPMYHGTVSRDFTTFRPNKLGLIFGSPDPQLADGFAQTFSSIFEPGLKEAPEGSRVYKVFMRAKNPFDFENRKHVDQVFGDEEYIDTGRGSPVSRFAVREGDWHDIERLADRIKQLGFDGLYVEEKGVKNLAVFDPKQITSATGNVGAYGQRPVTEEEADRRGMTADEANRAQRQGDIRFSLTPELRKFSRGSVARDENGNPQVYYHGTPEAFEGNIFKSNEAKNRRGNVAGYYFTPEPEEASWYAGDREGGYKEGAQILPVYLAIKDPFIPGKSVISDVMKDAYRAELEKSNPWIEPGNRWFDDKIDDMVERRKISSDALNGDGDAYQRVIKAGGYDGFQDGRHLVAFEPTQIKSAIGNVGSFGQRPVTAEEAARVGMTEDEANRARRQGDYRFSLSQEKPIELYRAAGEPEARTGAHFSASRSDAAAYQDNPGFGGPNLYKFSVNQTNPLDLPSSNWAALRRLAEVVASIRESDASTLLETWKDSGYVTVFQVLENARKVEADLKEKYDWISFPDDYPAGAKTWKYLGEKPLLPTSPSSIQKPDIKYSLTNKPVGQTALEDAKNLTFKNQTEVSKYLGDLLKKEFPEGLDKMDADSRRKLAELFDRELSLALTMPENADAIGWYNREMQKVFEILRSPELDYKLDDPVNRGIFNAILAVTSNGQKVVPQFLKTAELYENWLKTGKIPPVGKWGGERNKAIKGHLTFLNQMIEAVGPEDTVKFLTSDQSLGDHLNNLYGMVAEAQGLPPEASVADKKAAVKKYLKTTMPSGELVDYNTVGAAVLGPKLGGGFFANLYGKFDRLTMDRWFMRTFHRLTGRLGEDRPEMIKGILDEARQEAADVLPEDLSDKEILDEIAVTGKQAFKNYKEIKKRLKADPDDADAHAQDVMRRLYNRYVKANSGLYDAPDNGRHRKFIREVIDDVQKLRAERGEEKIDTSDVQAILWYLEKDIWNRLRRKTDSDEISAIDKQTDDETGDAEDTAGRVSYSDGARELYRQKTKKDYVFKNEPVARTKS